GRKPSKDGRKKRYRHHPGTVHSRLGHSHEETNKEQEGETLRREVVRENCKQQQGTESEFGPESTIKYLLIEKVVEFQVNLVRNHGKVLHPPYEIQVIHIDRQYLSEIVRRNPFLVALIEVPEIVQAHGVLKIATAFLDIGHQFGDIRLQVDQQIRWSCHVDHGSVQIEIACIISFTHQSCTVQVVRKNVSVFVYGSVLNYSGVTLLNLLNLPEPCIEEVDLQVKRPARHVIVKIAQVGIFIYRLVQGCPAVMLSQACCKLCLTRTNISRYRNVSEFVFHRTKLMEINRKWIWEESDVPPISTLPFPQFPLT